uniref:hypothetical protein n=1 Tax=Flavobacterium sp. TaxID=239 RepID=UPI00404A954E
MKKYFILIGLLFYCTFAVCQAKDSLNFYKNHHTVPIKYKLEHFGLYGKVKSFYEVDSSDSLNTLKTIYEFNENGNLEQVINNRGKISQKYTYNFDGKLVSFITVSRNTRTFEVKLNENNAIIQLVINNNNHGISTVKFEYNKNGYYTKQFLDGDTILLQENKYHNDVKLTEIITYDTNKVINRTQFTYTFFEDFVQIKLVSKYAEAKTAGISYLYVDYYGNNIYGFPEETNTLSKSLIKKNLTNFITDKNNNWIKNQSILRVITYY